MFYICDICEYKTTRKNDLEKHKKTIKHKQKVVELSGKINIYQKSSKVAPKSSKKLQKAPSICSECGNTFSKKANMVRHILQVHKIDIRKKTEKNRLEELQNDPKFGITDETFSSNIAGKSQNIAGKNEEKSFTCEYCFSSFIHQSSFSRHRARCIVKQEKLRELNSVKKELADMKKEMKQKDNIIENATKANKYAMSTFNTLAHKFVNAPPLRKIKVPEIKTIMYKGVKDDELVAGLIYYNRNKVLIKFIGNSIVSSYKKENPHDQSFWNSDTQRLSYIIRAIANENTQWVRNSGGTQVMEYIIQPILDYLDKEVRTYIKTTPQSDYPNIFEYNDHMLDAHILSQELTDKKNLGDQILTYISPYFHFGGNDQLELV